MWECGHDYTGPITRNLKFRSSFLEYETKSITSIAILFEPSDHLFSGIGENLPKLKNLKIQEDSIKFIDKRDFENMNQLESLDLSDNPIQFLPDDVFSNLYNLKVLELAYCGIEKLPKAIFWNLARLEYLGLRHNRIRTLDKKMFTKNLQLKEIWLLGNDLQIIDVDFTKLKRIEKIVLAGCGCVDEDFCGDKILCSETIISEFQTKIRKSCMKMVI